MIRQRCRPGKCGGLRVMLLVVVDVLLSANDRPRKNPIGYLTCLRASANAACIAGKIIRWRERHLARQSPRKERRHDSMLRGTVRGGEVGRGTATVLRQLKDNGILDGQFEHTVTSQTRHKSSSTREASANTVRPLRLLNHRHVEKNQLAKWRVRIKVDGGRENVRSFWKMSSQKRKPLLYANRYTLKTRFSE